MNLEYENDRVLKSIFPDKNAVPDTSETYEYLHKLCSMPLSHLKKEETSLIDGTQQIVSQTEDIAISNYKTFIKAAECSREIHKGFQQTSEKLEKLLEKLPEFQEKCDKFVNVSKEIGEARRINGLTLKNNVQLLEILELPQLMNSCIHEEKYEEALELSAYVQRLGSKCTGIPIINEIVSGVEASWHTMLTQMLAQLKTDIQLPKCLQIIGYIKRMQAFTEAELKLKFLQLRDSYLKDVLCAIPNDDPQQHLLRTVEVTRVCLFNIITQYRAIFMEDEKHEATPVINVDSSRLFYSWLHEKIDEFLVTLEQDLARGVASLETCLGQCMYFGLSLSRVGADFRGLMASIFIRTITKKFTDAVFHCTKQFEADIEAYTLINKPAGSMRRNRGKSPAENVEGNQPPETLLDFYPLGVYTNSLLTIFNELRICSPIAIADSVTKTLQVSLETVARSILNFYKQEQQAFTPTERDHFFMFITCFAYDLVPYIQRCIHFIFPPNVLATNLGINVLQLQKESLTYLKQKQILESLQHLLPNKIEVISNLTEKLTVDDTSETVADEN